MATKNTLSEQDFVSLKIAVGKFHFETGRDNQLADQIDLLIENFDATVGGYGSKRRALFVIGETNSGKSWSIDREIASRREFQPFVNEAGKTIRPLVSMLTPFQCTAGELLHAIFREIEVPSNPGGKLKLNALYDLLETQLQLKGVKYIHLDEGQQLRRAMTPTSLQVTQDALKKLLQFKRWPLHVIVSGVSPLEEMLGGDGQIKSRSRDITYKPLKGLAADAKWVMKCLEDISVELCGLTIDAKINDPEEEFAGRLIHAVNGALGTMVEKVKETSLYAVKQGSKSLTIDHFAEVYRRETQCGTRDNVFKAKLWREIVVSNAETK